MICRDITRTPLNSFSKDEMNAKIFGKNVWKIMDFSVVLLYKIYLEEKREYCREVVRSGKFIIKLLSSYERWNDIKKGLKSLLFYLILNQLQI